MYNFFIEENLKIVLIYDRKTEIIKNHKGTKMGGEDEHVLQTKNLNDFILGESGAGVGMMRYFRAKVYFKSRQAPGTFFYRFSSRTVRIPFR